MGIDGRLVQPQSEPNESHYPYRLDRVVQSDEPEHEARIPILLRTLSAMLTMMSGFSALMYLKDVRVRSHLF